MQIVEVMPLIKSIKKESLTYFSSQKIPIGSIVSIDLRKKLIKGIVLNSKDGSLLKEEIKSQKYSLRKVKGISKNIIFQKELIKSASEVADYFASSTGAVISNLIPVKILENINKLNSPQKQIQKKSENENLIHERKQAERYVIQDQFLERYASYKSLVREAFAKKESVLFICPTLEDIDKAKNLLTKGIKNYTFVLDNNSSVKKNIETWNKAIEENKPVLIICTGSFLSIPRHDIGTIIIEQESSNSYRIQKRPYVDLRVCAEFYAKNIGARFYLGDIALRTETISRYSNGEFLEEGTLKFRSLIQGEVLVIDMKQDRSNAGNLFSSLSNEIYSALKSSLNENEQTFIFVNRKGLASSIICSDCGTVVSCSVCNSPMVLHGKDPSEGGNVFKCHICGEERGSAEKCINCDSWRLKTLGIGIETVEREIKEKFPELDPYILDRDHVKNPKQAKKIIDQFYNQPGGVLIGTQMALEYLRDPIENVCVASIDSLFSIPDFSIREKILRILLNLRSKATKRFYINTRKADDSIFEYARQGNLADFYRDEFKDRNKFEYPPFKKLIKISIAGTPKATEKAMGEAKLVLEPWELIIYPAFIEKVKGKTVWNGLLKLNNDEWPNENLRKKLISLPPQFKVLIDPPSLL
jgi:primosomal protein N'